MPHYTESKVAPSNRNITVRSSYFKTVNKRVCTNRGEDELDDEDNCGTGNCTLSGDQLKNPGGTLKRRKLCDRQNFEDVSDCFNCYFIIIWHQVVSTMVHSWS